MSSFASERLKGLQESQTLYELCATVGPLFLGGTMLQYMKQTTFLSNLY